MKRPWLALLAGVVILGLGAAAGFSPISVSASESVSEEMTGSLSIVDAEAVSETDAETGGAVPSQVLAGATFVLSDSTVMTKQTVSFDASVSRSSHPVVLYQWDFDGDGAIDAVAGGSVIEHAYADNGAFAVRLVTIDDHGVVTPSTILAVVTVVNRAPSAAVSIPEGMLRAQIPMQFGASASSDADGSLVSWHWEYGDGQTGEGPSPIHTYEAAGTYIARLTVTDDDGAVARTESDALVVEDAPPSARFAVADSSSPGTLAVSFFDTTVVANPMNIVHVGWDFGDGMYRSGGPSVDGVYVHVYAGPGQYVVTLYVIDKYGTMSVVSQSVWIRD